MTTYHLDLTDRRILEILQRDASFSNQDLAGEVHVSPATCLRRVRRLEDVRIIERRVAILDPARLGGPLGAISEVTLDRQGAEHLAAFETRAVAFDAVQQCYRVSPGPDFVLLTCVADMRAWAELVDALFTHDANVRNVKSFFSVRRSKFSTAIPILPDAARTEG